MIKLKYIKNGIFIKKKNDLVFAIEIKKHQIWFIHSNLTQNKTTKIVYQNNCLYKSDLTTLITDSKHQALFLSQVQQVLFSDPYWSIISVSNDIDQKLGNTYKKKKISETNHIKLSQLSTLMLNLDTFKQRSFYKDSDSCKTLLEELMLIIQFNNDTSTVQVQ